MITVLCGGFGGARFLRALASVVDPERVAAIINTGDDDWFHGLYVSPDPDIVTYALAGVVDEERGSGLRGDTFRWTESLRRFGHETWFRIGDRDLATHLHRTRLLREGMPLSAIVSEIGRAFGVRSQLLPMSDDRVWTIVETDAGDLPFQEFLVKRHAQDPVRGVRFEGIAAARPAPGVLEAIAGAEALLIAPGNPVASIGPILAVPGVREAMLASKAPRIAVSPIVGRESPPPPVGEMLAGLGYRVDATGVARVYGGLIDALVIDESDVSLMAGVAAAGTRAIIAPAAMRDDASGRALALAVLGAAGLSA